MHIGSVIGFWFCFLLLIGMIPLRAKVMTAAVRARQHRSRC